MARGRPKAVLTVSEEDRETLVRWTRRRTTAQALALRARIVLACAEGATNTAVSERLEVTPQTVGKWRQRYIDAGVAGLLDEPRPGRPREVGDEVIERIIVATLEHPPPGQDTHWSTRRPDQLLHPRNRRGGGHPAGARTAADSPALLHGRRGTRSS